MKTVWILMRPCEDSYYPGHPAPDINGYPLVFANHAEACAEVDRHNVAMTEDELADYGYYLTEATLQG